jgi:hypothetical protein
MQVSVARSGGLSESTPAVKFGFPLKSQVATSRRWDIKLNGFSLKRNSQPWSNHAQEQTPYHATPGMQRRYTNSLETYDGVYVLRSVELTPRARPCKTNGECIRLFFIVNSFVHRMCFAFSVAYGSKDVYIRCLVWSFCWQRTGNFENSSRSILAGLPSSSCFRIR